MELSLTWPGAPCLQYLRLFPSLRLSLLRFVVLWAHCRLSAASSPARRVILLSREPRPKASALFLLSANEARVVRNVRTEGETRRHLRSRSDRILLAKRANALEQHSRPSRSLFTWDSSLWFVRCRRSL